MAGTPPFPAFGADFRTEILFAMTMGMPTDPSLQPAFRWLVDPSYPSADQAGSPFNWNEAPSVDVLISDMKVTCGVTYGGGAETGTVAGFQDADSATVDMLDTQWNALIAHGGRPPDQVILADNIIYSMDRYTHSALFDVDTYTLYITRGQP